jgi:hypothetical protein
VEEGDIQRRDHFIQDSLSNNQASCSTSSESQQSLAITMRLPEPCLFTTTKALNIPAAEAPPMDNGIKSSQPNFNNLRTS